jgi:peptidyl-prolyl cis-trans isomerase SurA
VSATDKINAIERLDSIRRMIAADSIQFEQAVIRFSEDKNTVMNSGLMINPNTGSSKFEYQELAPEIAKQIYAMKEGEVSQPFVMMDAQKNREVCAIVKVRKKTEVHRANLTDDFQTIKSMLEEEKGAELLHDWILRKQQSTFIQIAPEWQGCEFEYPGWIH